MQRPNEARRREITRVAARMFATRPFHEVTLERIAAEARIGKGTLYVYFDGKEDLYRTLILEALTELCGALERELGSRSGPSWKRLGLVIARLADFAQRFPHLIELLRAGVEPQDQRLLEKRRELLGLIEGVLRQGVRAGELADRHPELTAQYVLAFLRVALVYRPAGVSPRTIGAHLLTVLESGLRGVPRRVRRGRRVPRRGPRGR